MKAVYDTTAQRASSMLADGMEGYSFARNQAWFKLGLENLDDLSEDEEAWLAAVEKVMYAQLQRSSFYDEGRNFVKYCADFGTAIMTREDDIERHVPVYRTRHLKYCCIDENRYGEADTLFIEFWADAYKASSIFGEERLPTVMREALKRQDMKKWKFTQVIMPVDKYGLDIAAPEFKHYYTVYWAEIDKDKALLEGYYQLKPFFVWRWNHAPDGGVWGCESPGLAMLPNIKQANSMMADYSRIVQQQGRPPLKATEGLNGRINLRPNGVTFVRPGEDFALVQAVGDPSGILQDVMIIQRAINEAYYTDFFLILSQNMEKQKTAVEVAGVQGERAALMSSFYGRLAMEFLEPLLEDLFSLEVLSGRAPQPPESLLELTPALRIDMASPLSQLQRRYASLGDWRAGLAEIMVLAQLNPQVLDNFNFDKQAREVAEAYGMNKQVVVPEAEVESTRQSRAQQQAQEAQRIAGLQETEVKSKAMANAAKAGQAQAQAGALQER